MANQEQKNNNSSHPVIAGDLCTLRPVEISDSEIIRQWRMSSHVAINFPSSFSVDSEQQVDWVNSILNNESVEYYIISENNQHKLVGLIFLQDIDRKNLNAEFGYYIGDLDYHGTGVAIDAEMLLLDHAFNSMGMHKIYCESLEYNNNVLSLHKQFGFIQEGVRREHINKDGVWTSLVIMGVLKSEYTAAREKIHTIIQSFTGR